MFRILIFIISFIFLMIMGGCSNNNAYSSDEAIKKGDVVYHNKVHNFKRFEQFLINLSNKKEDSIRVTGYTDEGDPIYKDLKFDGKVIRYTYDDSNDAYGGSKKGIKKDVCTEISEEENIQGEIDFIISGCTKNSTEMSYFLLRVQGGKHEPNS